jgi:hypothetical protein
MKKKTSNNVEDFECIICHKTKQRKSNNESKKLSRGVMKMGSVTCSKNCGRLARHKRLSSNKITTQNTGIQHSEEKQ